MAWKLSHFNLSLAYISLDSLLSKPSSTYLFFFFSFRPTWLSVFSPLVSPRVTGMHARWKIQIKPLKGTNEGVAQT